MENSCIVLCLGLMDYGEAWDLQKRLALAHRLAKIGNVLLLVEHPHVYTAGRRAQQSDVLVPPEVLRDLGVELYDVDRGGQVTYHGPGQLVAYGILGIKRLGGALNYVRGLEKIIIAVLEEFGITGSCMKGTAGVWADGAKIAAIGVKVSGGVTTHGFSLNVAPNLAYFDHIVPCGDPETDITSIERLSGTAPSMVDMQLAVAYHWGRVFDIDMCQHSEPEQYLRRFAS